MQPNDDGFTWCHDCDFLHRENRNDPPYRWLCMRHKRADGFGFVTRGTWDNAPPYLYAKDVNGGFCPLFKRRANGQMNLIPERTQ